MGIDSKLLCINNKVHFRMHVGSNIEGVRVGLVYYWDSSSLLNTLGTATEGEVMQNWDDG